MTTKPNRFATLAARFLWVAAAGTAILAAGALLFPEQFPLMSCLIALAAVASTSLVATALLAQRQLPPNETAAASSLARNGRTKTATSDFFPSLPGCADAKTLFAEFELWLNATTEFDRCQVFLRNLTADQLARVHPDSPRAFAPIFDLPPDSPLGRYFQETAATYLHCADTRNGTRPLDTAAREACRSIHAALCFPLRFEGEIFGLLFLGERTREFPASFQPPEQLINATQQVSLVISRLRLREQLHFVQEMELLGMMSRGLAHDLNNLITPAWTYLQLCQSGQAGATANGELLPMAMRNVETMREYVEEALFFSQNHQPQFRLRHIHATIQKVIEPLAPALKRTGLQLYTTVEANLTGYYDEILMRRLVGNLLRNALDASPTGSRIDIEALPLTKTDPCQDWLRLRIRDQGAGMSPENVKRIFDPDFSSKDRPAERRGSGLGLAICQKIVKLHHGEIQLTSALARGTTVEIDLPCQPVDGTEAPAPAPPARFGVNQIS